MPKSLFSRSRIRIGSLGAAICTCLILLLISARQPQLFQTPRTFLHQITSPASDVGAFFSRNTQQLGQGLRSKQELYRENLALKAELASANAYLQRTAALSAELAQLNRIYTAPIGLSGSVTLARIVGIDNNPLRHIFVIDKGSNDGVTLGQTVIDNAAIMGQVVNVYARTARVMMLSDSRHAISVKIERTGQRAILNGSGDAASLPLQFLPSTADIQVGDRIVSTGLDGQFPSDFLIGRVAHVAHLSQQEFAQVQVRPSAPLADPHYVLLYEPTQVAQSVPTISPSNNPVLPADTTTTTEPVE